MRRVFKGGAVVALIVILTAPAVFADDPPSVRIGPPSGSPTPSESIRIGPPSGAPVDGELTVVDLLWCVLQLRILSPIG